MVEAGNKILVWLLIALILLSIVQIASVEYFLSKFDTETSDYDIINDQNIPKLLADKVLSLPSQQSQQSQQSKQSQSKNKTTQIVDMKVQEGENNDIVSDTSLRSLEEILERAKVEVTEEIKKELPPREDILSMYGSKPIIMGLDRCETFRNTIAKGDGFIGPAGMFNTGTNLLQSLLTNNCYLPDRIKKHGKGNVGMRFQVPWGKHSPVSWRHKHSAPSMTKLNQTEFLPAVVIKDPYTWMDSMCRHRYAASWKHFEGHCPNLIPITPDEKAKVNNATTVKVDIFYRKTNVTHHDSLADLWNTWYGNWIDAEFPRLIVRFEDLLFHAEQVLTQVCECAGGKVYNISDFKYSVGSAKTGAAHKGSNGLVKSITKYGDKSKRLKSYTKQDLTYAIKTLKNDIMNSFGYDIPNSANNSTT